MPCYGCATSVSFTRARYRMPSLSALFMACALTVCAGAAEAQGVAVSSTTRLETVMTAIRTHDRKAARGMSAQFDAEAVPGIRAWLVRGAAGLDAPRGAALARKALKDPSPLVRLAAVEALAQTDGAKAVPDLTAALAGEKSQGVRHGVVFWLGQLKTPAAETALESALAGDADPNVRIQAARSLKHHGTPAARQAVKNAKNDRDPRVRAIANEP
jgi:hypothetical protein